MGSGWRLHVLAALKCRIALTFVAEGPHRWQPMGREQFVELQRGQQMRDRKGRVWTITAEPFQQHGLGHVVARSGDLVRRISERFADEYMVVTE